jgi:ferritin-like protein
MSEAELLKKVSEEGTLDVKNHSELMSKRLKTMADNAKK